MITNQLHQEARTALAAPSQQRTSRVNQSHDFVLFVTPDEILPRYVRSPLFHSRSCGIEILEDGNQQGLEWIIVKYFEFSGSKHI